MGSSAARKPPVAAVGDNRRMTRDRLSDLIGDLLSILRTGEHDVSWSRYATLSEAINDLEHLRGRIEQGDAAARERFKLLCAPTGSIDEIAISSGWADTWTKLVNGQYRAEFQAPALDSADQPQSAAGTKGTGEKWTHSAEP